MSLTILKVWDGEYPWDVRVEKVCRSMSEAGHSVHLTARNRRRDPVEQVLAEGTVHRLSPTPWLGRRLEAAAMFPAFFNPRWVSLILRKARELDPDLLLARDLPLTPTTIFVGQLLGIPVVHDMAENYSAMIKDLWLTGTTQPGDFFVRNPDLVAWVERWCLRRLDHVIVVVEESRDRLVDLGFSESKISVVGNTPPLVEKNSVESPRTPRTDLKVVYLGLMERARGVETLIRAVGSCVSSGVNIHLELVGDGRNLEDFKELAQRVGLSASSVTFHGFLNHDLALEVVGRSDVGVIPHHVTESWNTTIPNKLFDYMAAGIPVLASNAAPVERIVSATECGRIFRDRDSGHLADLLIQFSEDPALHRFGQAGREAHIRRYNWDNDRLTLLQALERTAAQRGSHLDSAGSRPDNGLLAGRGLDTSGSPRQS
jgi:glycosyltransferase involved in cell wall biosynthesis